MFFSDVGHQVFWVVGKKDFFGSFLFLRFVFLVYLKGFNLISDVVF